VAMKSNQSSITSIIGFGREAGMESFIVSNIFPYSASMKDEILYGNGGGTPKSLLPKIGRETRGVDIRVASLEIDAPRSCPFIERGTVFITAEGDIAPCPELAHTHPAWYLGSRRLQERYISGNIVRSSLGEIWNARDFADLRSRFEYFDFPDCSSCHEPDLCWHRTVDGRDCYRNETPCGECLWAKGIVLCP